MTELAWHFVGDTLRDGRPVPPDGEWLVHEGAAVMCESGLHASRKPSHALQYAPGAILCLVECDDIVSEQDDKLVCRRRRIIKRIDATGLLRAYARKCALSVIHLWDAPAAVREYLETGDESKMDAARAAARAAGRAAARAAGRAAAWDAARAAAWDAAWDAAWAAAWDAAWDASRAAAWAAAWDASWAAARAAAWAAEWAVCLADFDAIIEEAFNV
jgi:hypothetical protein